MCCFAIRCVLLLHCVLLTAVVSYVLLLPYVLCAVCCVLLLCAVCCVLCVVSVTLLCACLAQPVEHTEEKTGTTIHHKTNRFENQLVNYLNE